MDPRDGIPDARDGLTRLDRAILVVVREAQRELGRVNVPTPIIWGRLAERGYHLTPQELSERLARLGAALEADE